MPWYLGVETGMEMPKERIGGDIAELHSPTPRDRKAAAAQHQHAKMA